MPVPAGRFTSGLVWIRRGIDVFHAALGKDRRQRREYGGKQSIIFPHGVIPSLSFQVSE